MNIIITEQAETDLDEIFDYMVESNPAAALRTSQILREKIMQLADFPALGRMGRVEGTRELATGTSYIAAYRVDSRANTVVILALIHAARRWPEEFEGGG